MALAPPGSNNTLQYKGLGPGMQPPPQDGRGVILMTSVLTLYTLSAE